MKAPGGPWAEPGLGMGGRGLLGKEFGQASQDCPPRNLRAGLELCWVPSKRKPKLPWSHGASQQPAIDKPTLLWAVAYLCFEQSEPLLYAWLPLGTPGKDSQCDTTGQASSCSSRLFAVADAAQPGSRHKNLAFGLIDAKERAFIIAYNS